MGALVTKDWGEHQRLTETQRPMFRTGKEIKARLYGTEESALRAASSQPSRSRGEVQSLGLPAFQARSKRAWSASLTSYLAFTCANASINALNQEGGRNIGREVYIPVRFTVGRHVVYALHVLFGV